MIVPFSHEHLRALPIVGILRGFDPAAIPGLVGAAVRGGLRNLEITMNSPRAVDQIRAAKTAAAGALNVGAGTVTTPALLDLALEAGASFIVTPTLQLEVVRRCVTLGVPVFAGAFSPTEIVRAWDAGATLVKVFPAETHGPGYIRALKAPFPHIPLLPTGGVDLNTLGDFVRAGADGFGIGSPLFPRDRIESGGMGWLEGHCRAFAAAYCAAAMR